MKRRASVWGGWLAVVSHAADGGFARSRDCELCRHVAVLMERGQGSTREIHGSDGDTTGATIAVAQYFFDIGGFERAATEVCAEYLTLLEQIVAQFKNDAP